jgi:UPF0716 protein FxsA
MAALLFVLFVVVPIVELYVVIQVGGWIGAGLTIGLLVLFTVAGVLLVKYEGLGLWARFRAQIDRGVVPTDELIDGLLILAAGVLFVMPGFVSDAVGLLLLVPPLRTLVRKGLIHRYRDRFQVATLGYGGSGATFGYGRIYDVENVGDVTPAQWRDERPRGELEP